jgi:hypothetical protein
LADALPRLPRPWARADRHIRPEPRRELQRSRDPDDQADPDLARLALFQFGRHAPATT